MIWMRENKTEKGSASPVVILCGTNKSQGIKSKRALCRNRMKGKFCLARFSVFALLTDQVKSLNTVSKYVECPCKFYFSEVFQLKFSLTQV